MDVSKRFLLQCYLSFDDQRSYKDY